MSNLHKIVRLLCSKTGQLDKKQVDLASSVLSKGGIIALPTDTLYGLAARVSDDNALSKIYKIKGRDPNKPLAVCISSLDGISNVADTGNININVFKSLLPGPITIVLKRSPRLNKALNPGIDTIGVRLVDHCFITTLCQNIGPLVLTSANKSGQQSPVDISDFQDIWDDLDLIFDAGELRKTLANVSELSDARAGSTVVDMTDPQNKYYKIVRDGCVLNRVVNTLHKFGYLRHVDRSA